MHSVQMAVKECGRDILRHLEAIADTLGVFATFDTDVANGSSRVLNFSLPTFTCNTFVVPLVLYP